MADPDLEIRGAVIQTLGGGGWSPKKNFFRPLVHQFGLEIRGCPAPRAPLLDLPLHAGAENIVRYIEHFVI